MWYSTTKLAKLYGVSSQTIRRWIKAGKFEEIRYTEGGHTRVKLKQGEIFGYARISSKKQQTSLENQIKSIQEKYPEAKIKTDIGSGFNFKRKGLKTLLERAMRGDPIHVVATSQDRISRTGFEFVKFAIELFGGRIELLDGEMETEEFDTKELIGFVTSFCNSYYGKRSAIRRNKSK
jgi:excisionase family DNA binding protein